MKSNYEEKKAAKLENAERMAGKSRAEAQQRYEAAKQIRSFIPPGQPILVGHHSEKRHRRDIEKIDNNMRKSIELDKKAEYYAEKAERLAADNGPISSDDPKALEKLREKLEALQWQREQFKTVNNAYRAFKKKGLPALEQFPELSEKSKVLIADWVPAYSFEKAPIQGYQLSNLGATIKTVEQRIAKLEKLATFEDREITVHGVRIVGKASENRIQMFFDGKPSDEIIGMLKGRGFRWAPTVGAWMRQYTNGAIYDAKQIANWLNPVKTFRSRGFSGRAHDATNVVFCKSAEKPEGDWYQCNESEIALLKCQELHTQAGVTYFGYL